MGAGKRFDERGVGACRVRRQTFWGKYRGTAAAELCDGLRVELCLPPVKWSTDNGAMIALATWDYLANDIKSTLEPVPGLGMEAF